MNGIGPIFEEILSVRFSFSFSFLIFAAPARAYINLFHWAPKWLSQADRSVTENGGCRLKSAVSQSVGRQNRLKSTMTISPANKKRCSGNVEYETKKFVATMNKDAIIKLVNEQLWPKTDADVPSFKAGDTITVTYKIVEGNKERLQSFRGVVIQIKGSGKTKMFTIRKVSNGVGVERIFPLYSPHIDKIEVNKFGVVRRARIYYLRGLTGKKARIKEKRMVRTEEK